MNILYYKIRWFDFSEAKFTSGLNQHQNQASDSLNQITELTARDEYDESRIWKQSCPIGPDNEVKNIDMKVIEPYRRVITHGGYYHHNSTMNPALNSSGKLVD